MNKKLKIAHFNEHLSCVGGVEVYLLGLIPALEECGHEQHFVFAQGNANLCSRAYHLPEINQIDKNAAQRAYEQTERLLSSIKPDVVHIHRIYNLGVLRACLDYGPTVVTCHDYLYLCPAGSFFHRRTKTICHRKAGAACFLVTFIKHCLTPRPRYAWSYYQRVRGFLAWKDRYAAILCPSESVRERLLRAGFDARRAVTLPYYCPYDPLFSPRPLPESPTILFVGRIRPSKGFDVFIKALSLLPEVAGILVGDLTDGAVHKITQFATKLGCRDRLTLLRWASREELPKLYQETSVFVFPSIWPETLGIVGLEAMAHGVPVVASDVGGVRQWLRDGVNGLLVPPKDATALARAIRTLLSEPQRLMSMGQAAIDTIREHFSRSRHVEQILTVYQAAVAGTVGERLAQAGSFPQARS